MKRVFLTGASSGIGLAIAQTLVARGDEVWGTSRDQTRLPTLKGLHPVRLDLNDSASIDSAFATSLAEAGHFDVVINNAGSGHFGAAEFLPRDLLANQFQTLVFGQIRIMQLALAAMRKQNEGLIINVTSLASRLPVPFMAAYNAAKAALAAFTMSIQLELADTAIHIVDLQPADIATDFNASVITEKNGNDLYRAKIEKTWKAVERNMQNAPKPDLVARRVCELIDHKNPPPRLTVGDTFQAGVAPLIFRFLPQRVRVWGLKMYYGL
jgi:NAD(P)-dependent dehydrogenase (short-subunit alcohol dehydrogenase family)